DLTRDLRKDRSLIPGTGPYFEHSTLRINLQQLRHAGHNVRLGNRLAPADRQCMVPVSATLQCLGYKGVPRYRSHCLENSCIVDLIVVAKPFEHALARDGIILASIGGLLTGGLHENFSSRSITSRTPRLLTLWRAVQCLLSNPSSRSLLAPDGPSCHSSKE